MSLVEKALEKLRTATPPDRVGVSVASRPTPTAPTGAAPLSAQRAAPTAWQPPVAPLLADVPAIEVDVAALAADRVLPPESEAHRAAGEYRAIKRALLEVAVRGASNGGADPRVIAISSALAGDGKTHTAINLALSFARERDHTIVLIDSDLPKGHLSEVLGIRGRLGLAELLAGHGDVDVRNVLYRTSIGGLWVVGAGRVDADSSELLGSQRMSAVFRQIFELLPNAIVLIDSPPLLLTTEAQVLATIAGQVVLVVRAEVTPRPAVTDAVAKIPDRSRIRIVLNGVNQGGLSDYYYHYGQYGSETR